MTRSLDELRRTLHQHAADVDGAALGAARRAHAVTRRAARRHRHRRVGIAAATGVAGLSAVAAVVLAGPGRDTAPAPSAPSTSRTPPSATLDPPLARVVSGVRYPGTLEVAGAPYWLGSSYAPDPGRRRAVVEISRSEIPVVLGWSTTPGTRGVVTMRVDGTVRSRSAAGGLETGLRLSPGEEHRVVVTAPSLRPGQQIGVALYTRPPG
jgi:hypothetical protein